MRNISKTIGIKEQTKYSINRKFKISNIGIGLRSNSIGIMTYINTLYDYYLMDMRLPISAKPPCIRPRLNRACKYIIPISSSSCIYGTFGYAQQQNNNQAKEKML